MSTLSRGRLYFLLSIVIIIALIGVLTFLAGLQRGRDETERALATLRAESFLAVLAPTATLVPSATPSETPSITPTPEPTATPSETPTPSPPPASVEEWAQRYQSLALAGLNSIAELEFSSERAQAVVQRAAQEQLLTFAPISYHRLSETPWAALAIPRTTSGQAMPIVFWQDVSNQNQFHSQILLSLFVGNDNYSTLANGVQYGVLRNDEQSLLQLVLIERPGTATFLSVYVLSQVEPGADFTLNWRSNDDPLWRFPADSHLEVVENEENLLPDLMIDAPVESGQPIRTLVNPPETMIEQAPFARQWVNSRWTPAPVNELMLGVEKPIMGYRLRSAALRSTPLTTMAQIIALAQRAELNEALNYATRLDVAQQAFALNLAEPARWLALYLSESGQPLFGDDVTAALRLFDNANRTRTIDAYFELDGNGFYRLAAIVPASPFETDLLTPAAQAPTFTATPAAPATETPAPSPQATLAISQVASSTVTATETISDILSSFLPTPTPQRAEESIDSGQVVTASQAATITGTTAPTPLPTETATTAATATPAPSNTPSPTNTETPTITPTPTQTATPTATDTPLPTNTNTPTDTSTPPLPLPTIYAEQPAPVQGILSLDSTANLRGGPGVGFLSIAPVENNTTVGVFGVTESYTWYLVRIEQPGNPYYGLVGWIFGPLLYIGPDQNPALLTVYRDDGTSLTPTPPTDTPPPAADTETPQPTLPATATPLQTPVINLPENPGLAAAGVPGPEADEVIVTVGGEQIPADPLALLPVIGADGTPTNLSIDTAEIQAWAGLFAGADGGWRPASAELLWPGSTLYVRADPAQAGKSEEIPAARVRIVGAPQRRRVELVRVSDLASALAQGQAAALLGSDEAPGIFLLDPTGDLNRLWQDENELIWAGGNRLAGMVVSAPQRLTGENSFIWVRSDGTGLRIVAQPFHNIRGVAADAYGGLWWIETPQAGLDTWQLWHYDPAAGKLFLRLKATSDLLRSASPLIKSALSPTLLAIQPQQPGDISQIAIFLDSADNVSQELYSGLFRLDLRIQEDGRGEPLAAPSLLLASGDYRGPLQLSPNHERLAYFVYDAQQPSLTSGAIRPANQVALLSLRNPEANPIRTLYSVPTRFEFLAPTLAWRGNDQLFVVRSRFLAGNNVGLDRFGVTLLQVPPADTATDIATITTSYVLPNKKQLRDIAPCSDDQAILLIAVAPDGTLELLKWNGVDPAESLQELPPRVTRSFVCWRPPLP